MAVRPDWYWDQSLSPRFRGFSGQAAAKLNKEIEMDFSAWSLSDTIIVIIVMIASVVQIAITIYKTNQIARQQNLMQADIDQMRAALRDALLYTWADSGFEVELEPAKKRTGNAQQNTN